MLENKYTVADMFAGAGGLSKAFQEAGAEIVWANEFDHKVCNLYRENFSEVCLVERDIKEVEAESIPSLDILVGGVPCQPFSFEGQRDFVDKERRNLFFEILRILKQKRPRTFLLDNVKALKSHDNGNTFNIITESLQREGYYIKSAVLNSIEYGNIPHNKERMYIVGFLDIEEYEIFEFPKNVPLTNMVDEITDLKEMKDQKYYIGKGIEHFKKINGGIAEKGKIYQLRYHGNNKYIVAEYSVCPALTSYIISKQYIPLIKDDFDIRMLTPTECFNFQGFFDIKIPRGINDNELYKYAERCSSVAVVKRIAESIMKVLDNKKDLNDMHNSANSINRLSDNNNMLHEFKVDSESENKDNLEKKQEYEEVNADNLIRELYQIKPGKEHAIIYHKYIPKAVNFIFKDLLLRQRVEAETNEGRKRIDIMFDNLSEKGFFHELKSSHNVFCPKIIIECKNYSSTPLNPEIDQLIGRFNNHIGKFGILICRNIEDRKKMIIRCRDALNGGQGYIIVLCDDDIKELLNFREKCEFEGINNYLRDKLDELIL